MTLLVRNEADMVEANLDYHLAQGVDHVIVTDHGSTDGTDELLRPYEREGVVTVLRDDTEGHHQSRRVTAMAQLALREHRADWVLHNDADEFWWPVSGSLRDVFAAIPAEYGQFEVRRVNFLPVPDARHPFHECMVYRERRSLNFFGEPLESKRAHRPHPDVVVAPGNHVLVGGDLRPVPITEMVEIFHFPIRDYEQFERKVVQIGTGYELLPTRTPGVGRDQLELLALHRRGELRGYFDAVVLDDEARRRGLEDGSIVLDRRLESFMADLAAGRAPAAHAGGAATHALVANALSAESTLATTRAALVDTNRSLEATLETLCQVQNSRLMRSTAHLRRLWYRLTGANV